MTGTTPIAHQRQHRRKCGAHDRREARRQYTAIVDRLQALGISRNRIVIQLHELPAHGIAIRGGLPMSEIATWG
jgi:hypothetical protein